MPYSAEYHAKVPPERSDSATAVRVDVVARVNADYSRVQACQAGRGGAAMDASQ